MMRYLLQMIIFDYALRLHNDSDTKIIPRGKGFGSKNADGEGKSQYVSKFTIEFDQDQFGVYFSKHLLKYQIYNECMT